MKIILILFVLFLPTNIATPSPLLIQNQLPIPERINYQKELETELSVYRKIKLTPELKRKLIRLELELEQKRPPV